MSNAEQFFLGSGGKSATFENIGDTITGTIVSTAVQQQTAISDGKPLVWDNGDPRLQLVVRLQTTTRDDDDDDDGIRAVYVKGSKKTGSRSLHDAVATAVRQSGAKALTDGGTLTVTYVDTEPSQTRGFSDRKLYTASYAPPAPPSESFLQGGPLPSRRPVEPGQEQFNMPAAPAPAAGMTPEQAAAFTAWQKSQLTS